MAHHPHSATATPSFLSSRLQKDLSCSSLCKYVCFCAHHCQTPYTMFSCFEPTACHFRGLFDAAYRPRCIASDRFLSTLRPHRPETSAPIATAMSIDSSLESGSGYGMEVWAFFGFVDGWLGGGGKTGHEPRWPRVVSATWRLSSVSPRLEWLSGFLGTCPGLHARFLGPARSVTQRDWVDQSGARRSCEGRGLEEGQTASIHGLEGFFFLFFRVRYHSESSSFCSHFSQSFSYFFFLPFSPSLYLLSFLLSPIFFFVFE